MSATCTGDYTAGGVGSGAFQRPGDPALDDRRLRDVLEQVPGGRGLIEQAAYEGLGAPERLEHEDLLQRPFLEVEEDGITRGRDDVLRVPLETHPAEVSPRNERRSVCRGRYILVARDALDRVGLLQPVVESLAGPDVVVLEVDH